jgi:hypothetical protein
MQHITGTARLQLGISSFHLVIDGLNHVPFIEN